MPPGGSGNINLVMSADDAKVVASIVRQKQEFKKTTDEVGRSGRKQRQFREEISKGGQGVQQMVAGYLSVAAAITGALAVLRNFNQEQERGAQSRLNELSGVQKLAQISGGDASRLAQLRELSFQVSAQNALPFETAASTVFSTLSQPDLTPQDALFFGRLSQTSISGDVAANTIGQLFASFPNQQTSRQRLSQVIKAAEASPVSTNEFAPGISRAAATAGRVGASQSELLALVAVLANNFGSASEAGTRVNSLAKYISKNGPHGVGILGAIPAITARLAKLPPEEHLPHFGRAEAQEAYDKIVEQMGKIRALQSRIEASTDLDLGQQNIEAVERVFGLELEAKRAENLEELASGIFQGETKLRNRRARALTNVDSIANRPGFGGSVDRFGRGLVGSAADAVGVDIESVQRTSGNLADQTTGERMAEATEAMLEEMRRRNRLNLGGNGEAD